MKNYTNVSDFLNDLVKTPGQKNLVLEDGVVRLRQEYSIQRSDEIFGAGNWNIQSISNEPVKMTKDSTAEYLCIIVVEYRHPINGCQLTTKGAAPIYFSANEQAIQSAFLNAISKLGLTFGEGLSKEADNRQAQPPKQKKQAHNFIEKKSQTYAGRAVLVTA